MDERRTLTVWRISFKREENSPWEEGLMIGKHMEDYEKMGNLYDFSGTRVEGMIWDYKPKYYKGVATFTEG